MENQLAAAKKQLTAANEGLTAATRLSQELELKQHHIAALKHEITTMEELLKEANNKVRTAATAQVMPTKQMCCTYSLISPPTYRGMNNNRPKRGGGYAVLQKLL